MLSGLRNPTPRPPREPEPKKKSTMKIALVCLGWIAAWGAIGIVGGCALTGCVQTEVVRKLPDGGEERTKSYGLTDRAGRIAEAGARYYFRVPAEPEPSK